ncbi:hypothetical protein EPICR_10297 [Candidatus Desulfarcum epimagneticum]|uniref:Uncharacterized protein n=1 Tax=uncultured Desulfobacteraceae bacterium TaxID=218296 RepID=A0A484HEB6_9BACT|nr:hypothetical protein EPICR_10297 [uncultured Desulfobacteraceae bacterium]
MGDNRREKKISEMHHVFQEARKILGVSYLASHWKKSKRQIYAWGADPDHCEVRSINPLEKLKLMLIDVKEKGDEETIQATLRLLARPLGYDISPMSPPPDISREINKIDIFSRLFSNIAEVFYFTSKRLHKKKLDTDEKSELQAIIDRVKASITEIQIFIGKKK